MRKYKVIIYLFCLFLFFSSQIYAENSLENKHLQLRTLISMLPNTDISKLNLSQIQIFHQQIAAFWTWYQKQLPEILDLQLSYIQLDHQIPLDEFVKVSENRYFLEPGPIIKRLRECGIGNFEYDEVMAYYAWQSPNHLNANLAYGGLAFGPGNGFLGDVGFSTSGIFGWSPERISQISIHEILHNIDKMFEKSGFPEFLNPDDMGCNMKQLIEEEPNSMTYSDDEMLKRAGLEALRQVTFTWENQLVYYNWMLQRIKKEKWLKLKYGNIVQEKSSPYLARPLYKHIIVERTDSVYLSYIFCNRDLSPVENSIVVIYIDGIPFEMEKEEYHHKNFEGETLFSGYLYNYELKLSNFEDEKTEVPILYEAKIDGKVVAISETRLRLLNNIEISVPKIIYGYVDIDEPATITVKLAKRALEESGPLTHSNVSAYINEKEYLLTETSTPGVYQKTIDVLPIGEYTVYISVLKEGEKKASVSVIVDIGLSWGIDVSQTERDILIGDTYELITKIKNASDLDGFKVYAEVNGKNLDLKREGQGIYCTKIGEDILNLGANKITIFAIRTADDTKQEKTFNLRGVLKGEIVILSPLIFKKGEEVTLQANIINEHGNKVKGKTNLMATGDKNMLILKDINKDGIFEARMEGLEVGRYKFVIRAFDGDILPVDVEITVN